VKGERKGCLAEWLQRTQHQLLFLSFTVHYCSKFGRLQRLNKILNSCQRREDECKVMGKEGKLLLMFLGEFS